MVGIDEARLEMARRQEEARLERIRRHEEAGRAACQAATPEDAMADALLGAHEVDSLKLLFKKGDRSHMVELLGVARNGGSESETARQWKQKNSNCFEYIVSLLKSKASLSERDQQLLEGAELILGNAAPAIPLEEAKKRLDKAQQYRDAARRELARLEAAAHDPRKETLGIPSSAAVEEEDSGGGGGSGAAAPIPGANSMRYRAHGKGRLPDAESIASALVNAEYESKSVFPKYKVSRRNIVVFLNDECEDEGQVNRSKAFVRENISKFNELSERLLEKVGQKKQLWKDEQLQLKGASFILGAIARTAPVIPSSSAGGGGGSGAAERSDNERKRLRTSTESNAVRDGAACPVYPVESDEGEVSII